MEGEGRVGGGEDAIKPGGREGRINVVNETLLTKMSLLEKPGAEKARTSCIVEYIHT